MLNMYITQTCCIDYFASVFTAICPFSLCEREGRWILKGRDFPAFIKHRMFCTKYKDSKENEEKKDCLDSKITYNYMYIPKIK